MTQNRVQLVCEVKSSVIMGEIKIIRKEKIVEKILQGYIQRSVYPGGRRGIRRGFAAIHLLGFRFRIPPGACMSVSCEYCQVEISATG